MWCKNLIKSVNPIPENVVGQHEGGKLNHRRVHRLGTHPSCYVGHSMNKRLGNISGRHEGRRKSAVQGISIEQQPFGSLTRCIHNYSKWSVQHQWRFQTAFSTTSCRSGGRAVKSLAKSPSTSDFILHLLDSCLQGRMVDAVKHFETYSPKGENFSVQKTLYLFCEDVASVEVVSIEQKSLAWWRWLCHMGHL